MLTLALFLIYICRPIYGRVAEWLGRGLQNLVHPISK